MLKLLVAGVALMLGRANAAEIQVAAAADLVDVQAPLAAAFQKKTGVSIRWVTGSSGLLAKQAENGAPFDVFLSASENYVREVVSRHAAFGDTVEIYSTGRLGLWSLSGMVRELSDLLKPAIQHVAIANPAHAPYGAAAKEALESAGLLDRLMPKIVYGENVRQTLQFGESGNADAVIVAWGLIHSKPGATLVAARYRPIRQTGAVLTISREAKAAREFLKFLMSPEAQAIFKSGGFGPPE